MKKPYYVSHFLVLKDLIAGVDVRAKSDIIFYLTSRIENIKYDLGKEGILFIEDISKATRYSHYKPYLLIPSESNIKRAKKVLKRFETKEVRTFLEEQTFKNHQEPNPTKMVYK